MRPIKTSPFVIAFLAVAFVLMPIVLMGGKTHANEEAGILDFLRSYTKSSISVNGETNVEYDPINGVRSLPIGGGSTGQMKKSASDVNKLNDSVDEETGINFFKFFRWIGRMILAILGFFLDLLNRVFS